MDPVDYGSELILEILRISGSFQNGFGTNQTRISAQARTPRPRLTCS